MDSKELLEKLTPFFKKNFLVLALTFLGLMFFAYGLIVLIGKANSSSDAILFEANSNQASNSAQATNLSQITLDIEGAIQKPGVYKLPYDSRMQDAFAIAGGLTNLADKEWVDKNLNLSQKLTDGAKIYVPKLGESIPTSPSSAGLRGASTGTMININSASIQELDKLPGVGLATAQKIIDNRPYKIINDLLPKKIVNSKVFEEIKDKITVY